MNKIYNEKDKTLTVHLISDSTGETIESTLAATIARFPEVRKKEFFWPMVRQASQIKEILENIRLNPGLVVYSILDDKNREQLETGCKSIKMPIVSPLDSLFNLLKDLLSISETKVAGGQHKLDDDYYKRVFAFEYAMQHDDGQRVKTMREADIILVGVSRTSKTPTSIYLANKGFKVGNIPLVADTALPDEIFSFKNPIIIGLIKDPRSLMQVRQTRLKQMGEKGTTAYADLKNIKLEINQARKIYTKYAWPSIDVSRRSVEETSATVIQIYNSRGVGY